MAKDQIIMYIHDFAIITVLKPNSLETIGLEQQVYGYGNPSHPSTPRQIIFRSAKEPLLYDLKRGKTDAKNQAMWAH